MHNSRLTLTNRLENLGLLLDYIRKWAADRGLPAGKRVSLESAAAEIFRHLVNHAYQPGEPGSIAVELAEQGPRLRLMFEDDAVPPKSSGKLPANPGPMAAPLDAPPLNSFQHLAESLIYYRTADRKNRLVVFLN
ncbi:MAG: ATP-binding protein [Deltaproteobacteria bacterium]|nr:ATP-binding protein [Deltaproteobacteria bacterium]